MELSNGGSKWRIFIIIMVLVDHVESWHALGNANFHCWPSSASADEPVPYPTCIGIEVSWTKPPPEKIKAEVHFNVTFKLRLTADFWPWAVSDLINFKPNFFGSAATTGITNANLAKQWCEDTVCPTDVGSATVINCCIHHVNVHSCPLSTVSNGLCGPWIPASGSIFTHSQVMVSNYVEDKEYESHVAGLYEVGPVSLIAHFKLAGMLIALERSLIVTPRTECGDGMCETEEGEACDTCPRDCGRCPLKPWQIGLIAAAACVILIIFAGIILYFRYKQEKLLWDESWIILWDDIKEADQIGGCRSSKTSIRNEASVNVLITAADKQSYIKTGVYNGASVALKMLEKNEFTLTMTIRREVRQVRNLDHPHLLKFIGATTEIPNVAILTEYCHKGGLNDVLENDDIPINWSFRFSFAGDITSAMEYLHTHHVYHGHLKSSNCVVDDRWTIKVTDYGLNTYRSEDKEVDKIYEMKQQLYRAPECLEGEVRATSPADVYAFSIILVEIATRAGPYGDADPVSVKPEWRPTLPKLTSDNTENTCPSPDLYLELIERCWADIPSERPTFEFIRRQVIKMNPSKKSAVDMMMAMMEKYSTHLESLVAERTSDLEAEKHKTDKLLYSMLPREVADELRHGRSVGATEYDQCSIYFSDIVGFTNLCSASTPIQVVALLNKLYITFDSVIDKYDVYKVETIGDAYMVVSGVPHRNGSAHAIQISLMAAALLKASIVFKIPHFPDQKLTIRIGIHSGSVCAGVVGLKMPRYCLFGDTVNTASRMESNGEAYKIHVSDVTREYLVKEPGFELERRGTIPIKGKGEMKTWWFLSVNGQSVDAIDGVVDMDVPPAI